MIEGLAMHKARKNKTKIANLRGNVEERKLSAAKIYNCQSISILVLMKHLRKNKA